MDISIINISTGDHILNKEALKDFDVRKLTLNVTSRLRYSSSSDYLGFQIDMVVMQENVQVFKSGFLVGLAIVDWAKDLQNGLDLNNNREKLPEICKTVWLVATGIVAMQSSDDKFSGIILPSLNYDDFSKEVILMPHSTN